MEDGYEMFYDYHQDESDGWEQWEAEQVFQDHEGQEDSWVDGAFEERYDLGD